VLLSTDEGGEYDPIPLGRVHVVRFAQLAVELTELLAGVK
jgi:hypothetical protein